MSITNFDPNFYRTYYSDLHLFKTRRELRRHFSQHGRTEGRFPTAVAARKHFEMLNGPAPAEFDVKIYQQLNPDLAKLFSNPIQYEMHFLEFGRFEERPYSASESSWQSLLNVYDFNLLNESWLPAGGVGRDQAIMLMETDGIARLAPIARDWIFDPRFYRAQYKAEGDDVALYREWLHTGFPARRAPNESQAIIGLMGSKPYPAGLDWKRYCKLRGIDVSTVISARIKALETFFERPLDSNARACVSGTGASHLFEAVGNYNLVRGRYRHAVDAFELAVEQSRHVARLHLRLGDAHKALEEPQPAIASYRQALTLPDCSIWALIHAVNIMLSQKMFHESMELVREQSERFRAHELFDNFVDEVAGTVYRAVSEVMHGLISDDRQDAMLDTYADARLGEVNAFVRALKIGDTSLRLPATSTRRIAILACLDLAQCTFYRVEQKRRLLEERGIKVDVFDFNDPLSFMSALPGAAAAIFYRVPCYPKIVEAILYARSLGIETFFDIDDLVFTHDFPDAYESYENQISPLEYFGLRHGVALYRQAIRLCTSAIVSTTSLAEAITPLLSNGLGRAFVVPNGLDDRSERASRFARGHATSGGNLSLFYGSGTKAHNSDFSDIVAPALLEMLECYPRVRLVIVGYLRLDPRFDPHRDRITRFPFVEDIETYWAILASCDVNISVLRPGPIADCKSEIKWLEAAMLAIPSVVSTTRTHEDVIDDGETGFLARDPDDWRRHLRALIEDDGLRKRVGAAARERAFRAYGPRAVATRLESVLFDREGAKARSTGTARKRCVLICNVFFAPQSLGGATRVVEDNVDELLDRYGDEFEVSILSTYMGLKVGALRVHAHRGCPTYRIGTPLEVNMSWRPFNDDVLPAFRRVLDVVQPDLVHFHCIQRLTASIVEETLRAGVPYVVTVHDAWWISDHQFLVDQNDRVVAAEDPLSAPLPFGVGREESLLRTQRLKSLLNAAAATLSVSASFADLYRRAGATNVRVCENGLSRFGAPLAKVTPKNRIVLGHIGGRSAHKGATLIEVVLKLHSFRNLELLLIDSTLEVGEQELALWGTTPVRLCAPVERAKVDQLYAGIDVLLAPSIWPESFGLVVREALHFRSWVVVSDRGALAQDVVDGENGFIVDPSHSDGLAAVLAQIDNDVERFKKPPRETRVRRSSLQLDEVVDAYREVLDGAGSRMSRFEGSVNKAQDRTITALAAPARVRSP